jgi:hypothetical protein
VAHNAVVGIVDANGVFARRTTNDRTTAIKMHESFAGPASACGITYQDSESNAVIATFNALSPQDLTTLLDFLNTL